MLFILALVVVEEVTPDSWRQWAQAVGSSNLCKEQLLYSKSGYWNRFLGSARESPSFKILELQVARVPGSLLTSKLTLFSVRIVQDHVWTPLKYAVIVNRLMRI